MNPSIVSHQHRIDNLYTKISAITDPRDQQEWSKYLCVLTSGFIEQSLRSLLADYIKNNASKKVQNYFDKHIGNLTNCKTEKIITILSKFDSHWAAKFQAEIQRLSPIDREIKDSIDTIVANRHLIAHGKNGGITYTRVNGYYQFCKTAITILDQTIK